MRCALLFFVAILKIGTLKTEPIDFAQKNAPIDMAYPLKQNKLKDTTQWHSPEKSLGNHDQQHGWNDDATLKYQPNDAVLQSIFNSDDIEEYDNEDVEISEDQFKSVEQLDDAQLARFSNYLIKLLQRPGVWEAPNVLIKDSSDNLEDRPYPLGIDASQNVAKRSRYYRRYPWKRPDPSSYSMDYDPYNPCNPSRRDIFHLLVALHDARQGKQRVVNFCNRRRPASSVFTNIRFLGRRRK